ncbi:MAG: cytochrome c [Planctomycetia bacterium]|nr:cytochrome c [Planctomycetia bacterium]
MISIAAVAASRAAAADGGATEAKPAAQAETPAERGFRLLTTKPYLTQDFDQAVFDALYTVWEREARLRAESASPEERRKLTLERYGLTEHPAGSQRTALQYTPSPGDGWTMNCLACHTGKVAGKVVYGAPNSLYDLQTLTEDVRAVKYAQGKRFTHMDNGSLLYPLGGSIGTTNAVMFGQILLSYRDPDLTFHRDRTLPKLTHHDLDAIPWWHYKRKSRLYVDGFAPRSPRALMQFLLIPRNGPDKFTEWEADYRDIEAWILSLEAPKYPFPIDAQLASTGKMIFNNHCATCHGRYDDKSPVAGWPEKIIPIDEVGTDRVRLEALTVDGRKMYGASWFARGTPLEIIADPGGYIAPPLDGVWASAPYLHNGSVPTLRDLMHPATRPTVWKRSDDGYDREKVGLEVTRMEELPKKDQSDHRLVRRYFDTRLRGKSAAGHTFPEALSEPEKQAVLEYLKTL